MAVPSFSRISGAPYHFLNLGPPENQQKIKGNQQNKVETKRRKQGFKQQSVTVIAATSSRTLELPNHIATAIMATSVKFIAIFFPISKIVTKSQPQLNFERKIDYKIKNKT